MITKNNKDIQKRIVNILSNLDIDFATGIPCGVLKNIIYPLSNNYFSGVHIKAQNEPEAIGIASGASLAGKIPLVYMQNSGFLKSINEICSLPKLYNLPMLMVVSHRGCVGENAPQHFLTGKITEDVIKLIDIPKYDLNLNNVETIFNSAISRIKQDNSQAIILAKRGWDDSKKESNFNQELNIANFVDDSYSLKSTLPIMQSSLLNSDLDISNKQLNSELSEDRKISLRREEALKYIFNELTANEAIIATTGLISRSIYENYDAPNIFYNVGGFGMVSSIGLGFASIKPNIKTVVIDGDCSLLTNFGSMVTIGNQNPKNLIHIVLDNGVYGSCSEEISSSRTANFAKNALLCGYKESYIAIDKKDISYSIKSALLNDGPTMIHIPMILGGRRDFKRPKETIYLSERFKNYFSKYGDNNE
ncbi:MAG: thiamine pyrophosphate-dependent enzyme [Candidatus Woesearchaeota archaeon]